MDLELIKSLIKERLYDQALNFCQQLAARRPDLKYAVMRQKSYIYTARAEYKAAVAELSSMIEADQANLGDYHSAASWALCDGQLEQALEWLLIVLKMGEEQNEEWFRSSALCLTAYICMELGEYGEAMSFLDKDESADKDSSFFVPNKGFCEVTDLRAEIQRRAFDAR